MLQVLKSTGASLVQMRAMISVASIVSEYWISYFSLKRVKEGGAAGMAMNNGGKRLLLLKELLLSMGWQAYLLKKINEAYSI
jgi:hypothetical protein